MRNLIRRRIRVWWVLVIWTATFSACAEPTDEHALATQKLRDEFGCQSIDWIQNKIRESPEDIRASNNPFDLLTYLKGRSSRSSVSFVAESFSAQREAVSLDSPRVIVFGEEDERPARFFLASPLATKATCRESAETEWPVEGVALCDGDEDTRASIPDSPFYSPWRFFKISKTRKNWTVDGSLALTNSENACFGCHGAMPIVSGYPIWESWYLPVRHAYEDVDKELLKRWIRSAKPQLVELIPHLSTMQYDDEFLLALFHLLESGNFEMSDHVGKFNGDSFWRQLSMLYPERAEEIENIKKHIVERSRTQSQFFAADVRGGDASILYSIIRDKPGWPRKTLQELEKLEDDVRQEWLKERLDTNKRRSRLAVRLLQARAEIVKNKVDGQVFGNDLQSNLLEKLAKTHSDVDILLPMALALMDLKPMKALQWWSTARFPLSLTQGKPLQSKEPFHAFTSFGDVQSSPFRLYQTRGNAASQ